jgi:isoquinoline 1-oxidoreductase beta subunit
MSFTRRFFLVSAVSLGGGLALGAAWVNNKLDQQRAFRLPAEKGAASFGAWLVIHADNRIEVAVPNQEMGQGITTTIPMLVAEELDAAPSQLRMIQAPIEAVYANPTMVLDGLPFAPGDTGALANGTRWTMERILRVLGVQATGGSTSTRNAMQAAREAGASARALLVKAAAQQWGVPASEVSVAGGVLRHVSGRSATMGELAASAAGLTLTEPVSLKKPEAFRLIGKGIARLDVPAKTDGTAAFAIDVRLPGMRYAAIAHGPSIGATLTQASFDPALLSGSPQLVKGERFVAVIADSYWQAKTALAQVKVQWDEQTGAGIFSDKIVLAYQEALNADQEGRPAAGAKARDYEREGQPLEVVQAAAKSISAGYRVPFLAHATMEPMNCTVYVKDGRCEVWVGNQAPTLVKWAAASAAGLPNSDTTVVHTPFLGGGFGRRAELDYVREAVQIALAAQGAPVQTIWSREEDTRQDMFRPAAACTFQASLDEKGAIKSWVHRIAGPSVTAQFTKRINPVMAGGLPDKTNAEGATHLPYGFEHRLVRHLEFTSAVPVGFWRSVGHSFNAFFVESFVDECALAAGVDGLAMRRKLLAASTDASLAQRFLNVLEAAANRAGWSEPLKPVEGVKVGRGIAVAESFRSIVAEVAEVQVNPQGQIRVTRVVAAVDCGLAIDPGIVKAQVASAIHYGLSAALYGKIDIRAGRVVQSNFHDLTSLTLADAPQVEVDIVNSGAELGGIGEVGTPPVAPAVANAVFAATGQRLRELPFRLASTTA